MKKFALLDIGSSTIKLSVYQVEEGNTPQQIYKNSITTKLAENLYPTLILSKEAIKRCTDAANLLIKEAWEKGAADTKAVSTGAARKASNRQELIDCFCKDCGLSLEIISGEKEAEIFFKGVVCDFTDKKEGLVAINIGGGSTEVVVGKVGEIEQVYSLPLGVVNLNETYLKNDPVNEEQHTLMLKNIKKTIKENINCSDKVDILIHTGGELDYMKRTKYPLQDYSGSSSHPYKVSVKDFEKHNEKIRSMKKEDLYAFMPENPLWMSGAVACNALALCIAKHFKSAYIIPSNKNLNDGLALLAL